MTAPKGAVRGRVLLVEDEDLLRWSIERYLAKRGFAVASVRDGTEATAKLVGANYDILITDLGIPGGDGLAIAAAARRMHAEMQVIVITGRGSKDTVLQALRQGVSDYIEKPFDLELLLLTVEKALEKTLVLRELIRLSRTDGLTGLYNQRHFYALLEAEIGRARRQNRALSLLLLDVDDFKRYNDRFGHLAGDAALARVAACLKRACRRDIDTAFRYGGDEFIIVLPEADQPTAAGVAGRVRALLNEEGIALTVSVGVAGPREGQNMMDFIREADLAMYRDKNGDAAGALPHAG